MTFPIVLQQSWFWLVLSGFLTAMALMFAALMFAALWVKQPAWDMVPAVLVLGVLSALSFPDALTWRMTLDADGVSVRAPLNVFNQGAAIRWVDVGSVKVVVRGNRTRTTDVILVSRDGGNSLALSLEALPDPIIVPAMQAILDHTKAAARTPGAEQMLQMAKQAEGSTLLTGYRVTGGVSRQ